MASSRKVGTNENISTYGTGKTYTSLATWESDTDNNLPSIMTSEVLEVYGDSYDDGGVTFNGATTDSSYFRIIRPASGNKLHSGAITTKHFLYTAAVGSFVFYVAENFSEIQDIVASYQNSSTTNTSVFYGNNFSCSYVGCVAVDSVNSSSGLASGFSVSISTGSLSLINCLAINNEANGIAVSIGGTATIFIYNCTSVNNGTNGFSGNNSTNCKAYGCGATGNGTNFNSFIGQIDCSTSAPTFKDAANKDYHLDPSDTTWKDADANTGDWHSSCGYDDDIDGGTRTGSWDIGFDEITYTIVTGKTCWGHDSGVAEANVKDFAGNWLGTGSVNGTGDSEEIEIWSGQYMECQNVIQTGSVNVTIQVGKYDASDSFTIKYKTAATAADCWAASWSTYSGPFASSGFVCIRIEHA